MPLFLLAERFDFAARQLFIQLGPLERIRVKGLLNADIPAPDKGTVRKGFRAYLIGC
jgi:hypothetical protein